MVEHTNRQGFHTFCLPCYHMRWWPLIPRPGGRQTPTAQTADWSGKNDESSRDQCYGWPGPETELLQDAGGHRISQRMLCIAEGQPACSKRFHAQPKNNLIPVHHKRRLTRVPVVPGLLFAHYSSASIPAMKTWPHPTDSKEAVQDVKGGFTCSPTAPHPNEALPSRLNEGTGPRQRIAGEHLRPANRNPMAGSPHL